MARMGGVPHAVRTGTKGVLVALASFFLVGCPPHGTPIAVLSTQPPDAATEVPTSTLLTVTFDTAVLSDSFEGFGEPAFEFDVAWSGNGRTATLTPQQPLLAGTLYTFTVDWVESEEGELEEPYVFSFTTVADGGEGEGEGEIDYRQAMRSFVEGISLYAKQRVPNFIVIPQNGEALVSENGASDGPPSAAYLGAIDGQGREDFFFGYSADNVATPEAARLEMQGFLDVAEAHGVEVLVTDYCSSRPFMDNSYAWNEDLSYISFAADRRDLDHVPSYPPVPYNHSTLDIVNLAQARNFLYVLDPDNFGSRQAYLSALAETSHDLIIIDAFAEDLLLTSVEVQALQSKAGGGARLVVAYMSIGEAEEYRDYWQPGWQPGTPDWIVAENPDWAGNYKVAYWDPEWQGIIFGDSSAYLDRILAAGFDGVYLDIIDAYEFFEAQAR